MRVAIHDKEALRRLTPSDIVSYLRSQGWNVGETQHHRPWSVWKLDDFEALVPLESTYKDYPIRIAEMLHTLEIVEERSQLELIHDIATSSDDVIRIQPATESEKDNSISIQQGSALVQQTRDILLAAACATIRIANSHPTRKPTAATEYLKRARFGQTERGSFILTVQSPVTPHLQLPLDMPTPLVPETVIPFERRVMETLFRSLAAVKEAAFNGLSTGSFQPFMDAVQQGVSANLCEALVALHFGTESRSVSFKMSWARVRTPSAGIEGSVEIPGDAFPVIAEAGRWLKETSEESAGTP